MKCRTCGAEFSSQWAQEMKQHENVEKNYRIIKKGKKATIICVGNTLKNTLEATQNMDVTILYYTTLSPFDSKTLIENFNENMVLIEPYYEGGLNYVINKSLEGKMFKITNIGVPHKFLTNYGAKQEHDTHIGLDKKGIEKKIENAIY
jgi:transketolase